MSTPGGRRWLAWPLFALGAVLLFAAGSSVRVAGTVGLFSVLEVCAGVAFVALGIAQRLPAERAKLATALRVLAAVLYFGSGVYYVSMPRGTNVGERCSGGLGSCTTGATAKQCQDGVVVEVPCRGPKGCFKSGAFAMTCDVSVAREGDRCMNENEAKFGCSEDHRFGLRCKDHRFERAQECAGPRGCFIANETQVACDTAGRGE